MADVAPPCGSLLRRRRGRALGAPPGPSAALRDAKRSVAVSQQALGTLLLLLTVLLQLRIPATTATEVVPQSSQGKEVGDQVTPSEVAEIPREVRQQLTKAPPATPSPESRELGKSQVSLEPRQAVKPLKQHSQSRSVASTTGKNATKSKKTRKGPKPRVRLIKVYKKVWRDRKPPRKPVNASHSPVPEIEEPENDEQLINTQKDVSTTLKSIEQDIILQTSDELKNESGNLQLPSYAQDKSHNHQQNATSGEDISSRSLDDEKIPEDGEMKNESRHQESSSSLNDYTTKLALTSTTYEPTIITTKPTLSDTRKSTPRITYSKVDYSQSTTIPTTLLGYDISDSTSDSYTLGSTPLTTEDYIVVTSDAVDRKTPENVLPPMNSTTRRPIKEVKTAFRHPKPVSSSTEPQTYDQRTTPNIEITKITTPIVEGFSRVTPNVPSIKDIYGQITTPLPEHNIDNLNGQEDDQSPMTHEINKIQLSPKESAGLDKNRESFGSYLKEHDTSASASNSYNIVATEGSVKESHALAHHTHEELHEKLTHNGSLSNEQNPPGEEKVGSQTTSRSLGVTSRSQNEEHDALYPLHFKTGYSTPRTTPYLDTTETASLPTENKLEAFDICKLSLYDFYRYAITSPYLFILPSDIHCGFTLNQNYIQAYPPYGNGYQNIANNYFIPLPPIPLTIRGIAVPESFKPRNFKPQIHTHHLTDFIYSSPPLQRLDETLLHSNVDSSFLSTFSPDILNYPFFPFYVGNNYETSKSKPDYSSMYISPPIPQDSFLYRKSSTMQPFSQVQQPQLKSRSQPSNLYPEELLLPKYQKLKHEDSVNFHSQGSPRQELDRYSPNAYIPSLFGDQYENPVVDFPTIAPHQHVQTKPIEEEPISSSLSMVGPASSYSGDHQPRNKNFSPQKVPYEEPSLKFQKDDRPSYPNFPKFDRDIFSGPEISLPKKLQPFSSTPPLHSGRYETPSINHPSNWADPLTQMTLYKPYSKDLGSSNPMTSNPRQSYFQNPFLPGSPFIPSSSSNLPNLFPQTIPSDFSLGSITRYGMGPQQFLPGQQMLDPFKTNGLPQNRNVPLGMNGDRNPLFGYPWNGNSVGSGMNGIPASPDTTEQRQDAEEELDTTSDPTTENPCLLGLRMLRDRALSKRHNYEDGSKRKHRRPVRHRRAGLS